MSNRACFVNQQAASACLPQGFTTVPNGPISGAVNYCGTLDDCGAVIPCVKQNGGGSFNCQGTRNAVGSSVTTSAGSANGGSFMSFDFNDFNNFMSSTTTAAAGAATPTVTTTSSGNAAAASTSKPNSANLTSRSPVALVAIVATLLAIANSAHP